MKIIQMTLGDLAANSFIVFNEETKNALLIDPGAQEDVIEKALVEHKLALKKIVLTHGHADHIGALNALREIYPEVTVYLHQNDERWLADPQLNLSYYLPQPISCEPADEYVVEGDEIVLDDLKLVVLETPGHTPGGISLYMEDPGVVFTGDALFNGSVGRTDFPEGSMSELIEGIKEKLLVLPDETVVLSGHGPATTIGAERKMNPFLGGVTW